MSITRFQVDDFMERDFVVKIILNMIGNFNEQYLEVNIVLRKILRIIFDRSIFCGKTTSHNVKWGTFYQSRSVDITSNIILWWKLIITWWLVGDFIEYFLYWIMLRTRFHGTRFGSKNCFTHDLEKKITSQTYFDKS